MREQSRGEGGANSPSPRSPSEKTLDNERKNIYTRESVEERPRSGLTTKDVDMTDEAEPNPQIQKVLGYRVAVKFLAKCLVQLSRTGTLKDADLERLKDIEAGRG